MKLVPSSALTSEDLRQYLFDNNVDAAFLAPGLPMPTVALAAEAIGVAEERIVKSLLFRDRQGRLTLAIVSGTARVDRQRLARAAGLDAPRLADARLVLEATGYQVGGVPPVGHRTVLPVIMDRCATELDMVYGGGGSEDLLLRIRPTDILRLTDGTVAEIVHHPV
jgi:Cys-tRNA(Pro)/Cys-tRNA(Cys) deacylase